MRHISKRKIGRLGGAVLYGGLFAAGASLGITSLVTSPQEAEAGERNFVRSISHDAVSGVRLDEELTIRFNSAVLPASVGPDTIFIRTGLNNGEQARGRYVVGSFMFDKSTQRRVVIRPEAPQEYYQLIRNLSRADATRLAGKLIRRIEKTGKFRQLNKIDRALVNFFGPTFGAGTRLDNEQVAATFPARGAPPEAYRKLIAGDDADHVDYIENSNPAAFDLLASNSEYERFFHPVDPATGVPATKSVLRQRQHRQVLISRRQKKRVMFVPDIPIRADLADVGLFGARAYSVTIPAFQPGVLNTVLTRRGRRPLLQRGGRDASTLFTTISPLSGVPLFLDNEARTGISALQKPRIINVTPPNAETFIDQTTDWEDPDNQFTVPLPARRTFTFRIRFAQPLDPRTVNTSNFLITKTEGNVPVAVGTFLNQKRLGTVEVELTPASNLDPASQYTVIVRGSVASLGGEPLGDDKTYSFTVGPGDPPLDRIKDTFFDASNRANPNDIDTFGPDGLTSAMWPAPPLFDEPTTGKLVASFMPMVGFGEGMPFNPSNPGEADPVSQATITTDLDLIGGQLFTFVTQGLDPADTATFGKQIEYEYRSVKMDGSTAFVLGRYPLVIRSQTTFRMLGSAVIDNAGRSGGDGLTNSDTVNGAPVGGLGGAPGAGGFRGGDGAFAPLTDAEGEAILDGFGNFQFDLGKFDGVSGQPGLSGGGGAGGFTGNHTAQNFVDPNTGMAVPDGSPERIREGGGGGGHATAGGDGGAAGGTAKSHPGGEFGGQGGVTFGQPDMSDQPINVRGVPTLGAGAGGAGGGGGGGEDDADPTDGTTLGDVGAEDSGGGGGGGGGGGVQVVARERIEIFSDSRIDCRGGPGGSTQDPGFTQRGQGAPGGAGAGGSIWLQCLGDIVVSGNSKVNVSGGHIKVTHKLIENPSGSGNFELDTNEFQYGVGRCTPKLLDFEPSSPMDPLADRADNNAGPGVECDGGAGGDGYLRFEDADGVVDEQGATNQLIGSISTATFAPVGAVGGYPSHPNSVMVVNESVAHSKWFNAQLDTPTFVPLFNRPIDGAGPDTSLFPDPATVFDPPGNPANSFDVIIEARSAPVDTGRPGKPDLFQATGWTPLADIEANQSGDRFLQFRVRFIMPQGTYKFYEANAITSVEVPPGSGNFFDVTVPGAILPRPFVDCISINIELR